MPNRLHNWNYRQIKKFLGKYNFVIINTRGSHHYFSGSINNIPRVVTVPFHGNSAIKIKTMESIIEQSGIAQKDWLK